MSSAGVSVGSVARLLNDNVDRLLVLCRDGGPQAVDDAVVSKIVYLLLDRYGPEDPALFWEGLSSTREPLPIMLGGLEAVEHAASSLLAERSAASELPDMRRALERMVDEVRGQCMRGRRRTELVEPLRDGEVARFLETHSEQFLDLCAGDASADSRRELTARLLSLLVSRYAVGDEIAFWSGLVSAREQPMAAVLDVLDAMTQAGIRLMMRRAPPDHRDQMWLSLDRIVDDIRSEYMRMLRISQERGQVVELSALEHLPGPLFTLAVDYGLEPVNSAGRSYLAGGDARCYAVFFQRDAPCVGCPLSEVLEGWAPKRCPVPGPLALDADPVGLSAYSATHALVHVVQMASPDARSPDHRGSIGRGVLENIGSGVVFIDDQGLIAYANQAAGQLIGRPLEGHPIGEALPGAGMCGDQQQHQLRFQRGAAEEMLVGYRCIPCSLDGLPGTVISFRDITETERLRRDMERMRRLSEVGRMCAVVAHEIRNPLAGLSATLDSIEQEASRAGLQQPMSIMRQEVDRLGDLVTSFFAFVRHRPPRRRLHDVAEVIQRAVRAAEPHTSGQQVETRCSVMERVSIDRDQIEQVLLNLLINAGQATPAGGAIKVEAALLPQGQLRIAVEDSGRGIDQAEQERIFDAFYTTRATGTGLGLSICYRIASDHGGRIWVKSDVGQGARFELEIPALTADAPA